MRHISNQDGFILVVGLILMTVLTTIALGSFAVSTTEVQVSSNYRSSVQAVTLAEGALAQVIYWFNNPATFAGTSVIYHGDTPAGEKGANFFAKRRTGSGGTSQFFRSASPRFSQFYDVDGNGTGDATSSASPALEYNASNDAQKIVLDNIFTVVSDAGNITSIKIFGSANPTEVALVQVTAQSKGGGTATIEAVLGPNPGGFGVSNGLEVGASGAFAGQSAKVHWSQAIIVGDVDFGVPQDYNPPQLTCGTGVAEDPDAKLYGPGGGRDDDPWVVVKVGGTVSTSGGPAWPAGCAKTSPGYDHDTAPTIKTNCAPPPHPLYYSNVRPGLNNNFDPTDNVSISKISYDDAKVVAKKSVFYKAPGDPAYPSYYYTKSGASEKNNIYDAAGTQYTFKDRIDGITKGMIFVDTTDQKIPNAFPTGDPSSNLQELGISGGLSFKGTMFLAANMKLSGLGNGTDIPEVKSPPWNTLALPCAAYPVAWCSDGASSPMCAAAAADRQTVNNLPIHLRGLVYVYGILDITGNLQIFGALITERGFTGSGTPEIWFDYDLKGGNPDGSPVFIRSWREVGAT